MKRKVLFQVLFLTVVASLFFVGCSLFDPKVDVEMRCASLAHDLTSSRGSVYTNFEIGSTGYVAAAGGVFDNTSSFPAGTYTITGINSTNTSNVTATIYGPGLWSGGYAATFNMTLNINQDRVIHSISIPSASVSF